MPQAEGARRVGVSRQSVAVRARALADDKQAWPQGDKHSACLWVLA
jgi:hypothetical protein